MGAGVGLLGLTLGSASSVRDRLIVLLLTNSVVRLMMET